MRPRLRSRAARVVEDRRSLRVEGDSPRRGTRKREEDEEEGQDIWRANRIARIMARRSWHMWRVLDRAARWTSEMLHVPAVWACVETIAGLLLERGTIEDRDGLLRIMLEVPHAVSLPKWRHRLFPSAKEVRELWHPGPAPAPAGETPTGARAASAATEEAP